MEKADRAVEICNEVEMRAGGEGESDGGRGRLTSNLTCEWPLAEWRHGWGTLSLSTEIGGLLPLLLSSGTYQ